MQGKCQVEIGTDRDCFYSTVLHSASFWCTSASKSAAVMCSRLSEKIDMTQTDGVSYFTFFKEFLETKVTCVHGRINGNPKVTIA